LSVWYLELCGRGSYPAVPSGEASPYGWCGAAHKIPHELQIAHPAGAIMALIILSSSDRPADRDAVRAVGATRYFKKPTKLQAFLQLGALVKEALEETPPPA